MFEYDDLYDFLNFGQEIQKRKNFDVFMSSLMDGLTKDLNESYAGFASRSGKIINYETLVNNIKAQGFKVLRNSQGKHKLEIVAPEKIFKTLTDGPNVFKNLF